MFQAAKDWNPMQTEFNTIMLKADRFNDAVRLCLELHSVTHSSEISDQMQTYMDEIWLELDRELFSIMPTKNDATVAWNIWHITRIEDITANILIANSEQVLTDEWLKRLNTTVLDTGNAMSDDEIVSLSQSLNMPELKRYRNAVRIRTKNIINNLSPSDMKRKINPENIKRVLCEGGVIEHPDSIWLLDFWGNKNVAGILKMPITRHQVVHLNDCMKLKSKILKQRTNKHYPHKRRSRKFSTSFCVDNDTSLFGLI